MSYNIPTMEEMLKAGVHFGHQSSRWHPKMQPYIYTMRNGMHIIDLKKTTSGLQEALEYLEKVVTDGGDVLFVGTKTQAQPLVEQYAKQCEMPYIKGRWIGGMLTNFSVVKKVIKKYLDMTAAKAKGEWVKYKKKEQGELAKELAKLDSAVSGLATMTRLPKAIFIVDIRTEKTAVLEANAKGIPVVAICDTNVNPKRVEKVIPANDDATRGIEMILALAAEACAKGKKARPVVKKEAPKKDAKASAKKAPAKKAPAKKKA